jgi:hypothetical protein
MFRDARKRLVKSGGRMFLVIVTGNDNQEQDI